MEGLISRFVRFGRKLQTSNEMSGWQGRKVKETPTILDCQLMELAGKIVVMIYGHKSGNAVGPVEMEIEMRRRNINNERLKLDRKIKIFFDDLFRDLDHDKNF